MSDPSPWPRNASFDPAGLSIAGVTAEQLASRYGTPLMVLDEDDFRSRCREFRAAFPRVMYAVKAFTARTLIGIAKEEGLGLLASTDGELQACLRAGVDPASVSLHGNNKSDAELRLAVEAGIGLVMADGADEIDRLDQIAQDSGGAQPVLLRVAPGVSGDTHAYLDTGGDESKFGTPIADGRALDALKRAHAAPGLVLRGVHAHIGSQLLSADPYIAEVGRLFDLLAEARDALGFEAEIVDIGGGFGITYADERPRPPELLGEDILESVARAAKERRLPVPEVMVEPGRALAANGVVTLYRVGSVKETPAGTTFVAVDGGMSDNIRPALYGARYTVAAAGPARSFGEATMTVVGRHCESGDVLATGVQLPEDVRPGDLVAFAATGAYGYSMASNYNRVGRPAVAAVGGGRSRLILRREDDADLDRLEVDVPPDPQVSAPPGVSVRPAHPRDARSFHRMWEVIVAEGLVRSQEVSHPVRHYRALFKRPWTEHGAWIVAVAGDEVVGHLSITREGHPVTSHVATLGLGVDERWRGRGIGAALIAGAFRWARSTGVQKVLLSVYPKNSPAIALYRRFGFLEEGRLVNHSRKPYGYEDEILMGRWLG